MVDETCVGKLVQYWEGGLRTGWAEGYRVRKKEVVIRPIGAKGTNPHRITLPASEVKLYVKVKR